MKSRRPAEAFTTEIPASALQKVENVATDSRKVEKNGLFIALKGARVDGHSFIPQVMETALYAQCQKEDLGVSFPWIKVSSCLQALKDIAAHYRRSLDIKVVGISGSLGKTSTPE